MSDGFDMRWGGSHPDKNVLADPFGDYWGSLTQEERNKSWSHLAEITKAFYAGMAASPVAATEQK